MARIPSIRFTWSVYFVVLLAFLAVYWQSFHVKPAGDDFAYIVEVHRGNHDGVWALFARSVTGQTYRPLTSVGLWAFGNIDQSHATEWIRALHLLSMAAFAAVGTLWMRSARLGYCGTVVAMIVMFLHPVLPQAVGSIDGFNSLASSAFLWLGAWCILAARDRMATALPLACACFIVSTGFKEYAFALVPLSILTIVCFWNKRRWIAAFGFAIVLAAAVVGSIYIRRFTIPAEFHGGWGYVSLNPIDLARNVLVNASLLASGILFLGNSIWVYVNQSPAVFAIASLSMLLVMVVIAGGMLFRLRPPAWAIGAHPEVGDARAVASTKTWAAFLLLSFVAASFPANLMTHVSEMYVPPIVLPFALLCGMAADGWRLARPAPRWIITAVAGVALAWSIHAIRIKIAGLVDVGRRADDQVKQILSYLPPDAHDMTVAVRYLESDRRARDVYAVFRMPDAHLLIHRNVLDWPRPYRNLVLDCDNVTSFDGLNVSKYDAALGWDAKQQKFFPLSRR